MYNKDRKNQIIIVSIVLFAIVIITNTINVIFKISNSKYEDSIEVLEDQKSNLRANYLSEISLDKLGSKAGEMEMKYVSSKQCYTISGQSKSKSKEPELKNDSINNKIFVTGY